MCKFNSIKMKFMKKLAKTMCCLVGTLLAFGGCTDSEGTDNLLRLSSTGVAVSAEGGSRSITVATYPKGMEWSVSQAESQDWFSYSIDGDVLVVTVEPSHLSAERIGELKIFSPEDKFVPCFVNIFQEGATEMAVATNAAESYEFDSEGGTYSFSVFTDAEWSISSSDAWITVEKDAAAAKASIIAEANTSEEHLTGMVTLTIGDGEQMQNIEIPVSQGTRAENPYYQLCGKWEITASKWYYSPNGSLNSLDYAPSPSQYYLIFDIKEGVYGESLILRNFLYPGTKLEVRYDRTTEGFVIPFGWTVLSYDVFFYVTLVSNTQFSYASVEVPVLPSVEHTALTPQMPSAAGFNYIGFGLWTYNDSGNKVAFGSNYMPTMFPMGNIIFKKTQM